MKHDSLDDLQASTYFGPTTISECVSSRKQSNKAGKQTAWPVKSLSLNTQEGPPELERSFLNSKRLEEHHHHNTTIISSTNEQHFQSPKEKVMASFSGFAKKANGIKTKDVSLMVSGPGIKDKKDMGKRFWDKNMHSPSIKGEDSASSVGTQTEQTERKKVKECTVKHRERERQAFKHSNEDSEIVSDDISDIFGFLDDMSVCDSLGVIQSSCYNSNVSLSQVTLKCDRLFHSLENTDDELKASVCKLIVRICEIEKKLESLSGVRNEISQALSKLNKLDEKIQAPEVNGRHGETASTSGSNATAENLHPFPQAHPHYTLLPHVFQCHTTGHNIEMDNSTQGEWCCLDGSNSDILRMKALKKNWFTKEKNRDRDNKNRHKKAKEVRTFFQYKLKLQAYKCEEVHAA